MAAKDGMTAPNVAITAPRTPAMAYPTTEEALMATPPGPHWAHAMMSRNFSWVTMRRRSTISRWIRGTMTYPPPRVKAPIRRKTRKTVHRTRPEDLFPSAMSPSRMPWDFPKKRGNYIISIV